MLKNLVRLCTVKIRLLWFIIDHCKRYHQLKCYFSWLKLYLTKIKCSKLTEYDLAGLKLKGLCPRHRSGKCGVGWWVPVYWHTPGLESEGQWLLLGPRKACFASANEAKTSQSHTSRGLCQPRNCHWDEWVCFSRYYTQPTLDGSGLRVGRCHADTSTSHIFHHMAEPRFLSSCLSCSPSILHSVFFSIFQTQSHVGVRSLVSPVSLPLNLTDASDLNASDTTISISPFSCLFSFSRSVLFISLSNSYISTGPN